MPRYRNRDEVESMIAALRSTIDANQRRVESMDRRYPLLSHVANKPDCGCRLCTHLRLSRRASDLIRQQYRMELGRSEEEQMSEATAQYRANGTRIQRTWDEIEDVTPDLKPDRIVVEPGPHGLVDPSTAARLLRRFARAGAKPKDPVHQLLDDLEAHQRALPPPPRRGDRWRALFHRRRRRR